MKPLSLIARRVGTAHRHLYRVGGAHPHLYRVGGAHPTCYVLICLFVVAGVVGLTGCRGGEAVEAPEPVEEAEPVAEVEIGPPIEAESTTMPAADLSSARWEPHHTPTPQGDPAVPRPDGDSAGGVVAVDPPQDVPGTLYLTGSLQYLTEPSAKPITETVAAVAIRDSRGDLADADRPIMGVMDAGHLASGPDAGRWIHEAARELLPAEGERETRAGMGDTLTPWRVTLPVGRVPAGDTLWLRLGFLEAAAERLETGTFPLPAIGESVAVSPDLSLVRKGDEMRAGTLEMVFEVQRGAATLDGQTVRIAAEPVRVRVLSGGDNAEPISRLSGWRCEAERATCVALTVPQAADLSAARLEVLWASKLTVRPHVLGERRLTVDQLIVPMEMQ